ncbi:MAG: RecX family transcriptional regulator [Chloroflexota bacterium]|nr:RecX family transcriptional regulator [Chloroflexota bacterium]
MPGRGEGALRRELELKGVAADTVSAVLEERSERADSDGADADAARRLLDRRRATFEREQNVFRRRQKAYALLARNGFDPEICREVSASFVDLSDGRA